jgi:hypothetical protein
VRLRFNDRFGSKKLTSLSMYSGYLYSERVKKEVISSLGKHFFLIMSGGYGLLRPDELIVEYNVNMNGTASLWGRCLPQVLESFATRNNVTQIDGVFSSTGQYIEIGRSCQRRIRNPPFQIHYLDYHGPSAQSVVPRLQGELFLALSRQEFPHMIEGIPVRTEVG